MTANRSKKGDVERLALQIVNDAGEKGILQRDLWKIMGLTSREGSRIAIRLEKKNLIRREKEYSSRRWTYRLYPVKKNNPLVPVINSPCIVCKDNAKCSVNDVISPLKCERLAEWVLRSRRLS